MKECFKGCLDTQGWAWFSGQGEAAGVLVLDVLDTLQGMDVALRNHRRVEFVMFVSDNQGIVDVATEAKLRCMSEDGGCGGF